jgi:hypothetical protein
MVGRHYTIDFHLNTYRWVIKDADNLIPRILEQGNMIKEKANLTVRCLNLHRFREDTEILWRLFNESFAKNDEVVPFEKEVFDYQVYTLKPFVDPQLIHIIEQDGKPIAFNILVPNLNELLHKFNGRFVLWNLLIHRRQAESAVILLIGALPIGLGLGISRVLVAELVRATTNSQYKMLYTTWVHANNKFDELVVSQWNGICDKKYVIFAHQL